MKSPEHNQSIDILRGLLDKYDIAHLECDGLTRVVHTILSHEGIEHGVFGGQILHVHTKRIMRTHLWVDVGLYRVDYRARMWLGDSQDIPHGVVWVVQYPNVLYQGQRLDMPILSKELFDILITPFPSIDDFPQRL
jgi:hypothetical protein